MSGKTKRKFNLGGQETVSGRLLCPICQHEQDMLKHGQYRKCKCGAELQAFGNALNVTYIEQDEAPQAHAIAVRMVLGEWYFTGNCHQCGGPMFATAHLPPCKVEVDAHHMASCPEVKK